MLDRIRTYVIGSRFRDKFILLFVVIAAVPVLALGAVSMYLIDLAHRTDVSRIELQLIDQKIEEVQKFLSNTLGILELQLGLTQTKSADIASAKLPWQQVLARELLEANPAFEEVSFIDLQGKERARESRSASKIELTNVSMLPKFREALEGRTYISDVYYTLSGPLVTLAAPMRAEGSIIQVISAEVRLRELVRSIELAHLDASGYLALVDRSGALIASGAPGAAPVGADLSRSERIRAILAGTAFDGLGGRDRYESMLSGVPVVGAGRQMPRVGWAFVVEWPLIEADAIVNDVRNQVSFMIIFSILAVLFVAPIFASRLVGPIKKLEAGAAAIEEGKFDTAVEVATADELEELAGSFNKMAQGLKRLQELKSEFVFIAAHELRTPVTAIKGYLSMIFEGDAGNVPPKMLEFLEPVKNANERLVQLVNDILEIARSEAGRIKVEVAPMDIRESIQAIMTEVKPLADVKRITLSYDAPPEALRVMADPARVKEVVMNFVSNAIKYNNIGGSVKVYHETDASSVTTHVEDNGFGMSEEDQKHMFEKFFRSEAGKIKEIQGTGLGLFITRELVEKMGGKIWFRSALGTGTRFSFSLPKAA